MRRFVCDVLRIRSVRRAKNVTYERRLGVYEHNATPMTPLSQLNKSELVELLQQSAVEHLAKFHDLEIEDPYCNGERADVTSDFEALCAYVQSDYRRCLPVCAKSTHVIYRHSSPTIS